MRRGRHAADDGSFARSAGAAARRGLLLLVVAAIIGIVLYQAVDDVPPGTDVSTLPDDEEVIEPDDDDDGEVAPEPTTTTVALRAPREVKVLAANATTVSGLATRISTRLREAGYNVLAPTDATEKAQATTIYYAPGFDREASALAEALGLPPTSVKPMPAQPPVADARGTNVLIVAGPELAEETTTTTG